MPTSESDTELSNISEPLPRSRERAKDKRKYTRSTSKPDSPQKKKPTTRSASRGTMPSTSAPQTITAPDTLHKTRISPPDFTTPNPFSVLPVDPDTPAQPTQRQEEAIPKPPPIFINNVVSFTHLCTALIKTVGKGKFTCQSNIRQVIVRTVDPDSYRGIVRYLKAQGASYHTYQLPEERSFRVVIRGLHNTVPPEDISKELDELGLKVKAVSNARHPVTKTPLHLFFIDLTSSPKNKEIFDIKHLYFSKIKVEEPYKRTEIVQCLRCQNYGHTRSYCNHPARCVRCAGTHESASCSKTRDTPATCVLCGEAHPSNYKGCSAYKDLQRLRRPNLTPRYQGATRQPPADLLEGPPLPQPALPQIKPLQRPPRPVPQPRQPGPHRPRPSHLTAPTPATGIGTLQHPVNLPKPTPYQSRPSQPLSSAPVTDSLGQSYSQVVYGQRRVPCPPQPPHQQVTNIPDISSQFSSFLGQFTSVANQLILAISSLVTLLQNNIPR